ncbi:MAG: hypothetical protein DVB29_05780 [Verrucomicrobia bacterium]|nr:MAG: hypothetical protein DVB29_05780 [Verrucomicrobiota bacterium]
MSTSEFYNEAMLWAADNIDFEDVKSKPNPKAWKYYTKRTTGNKEHDSKIEREVARISRN